MAEGNPLLARWRRWIIVPALAWGGILLGLLLPFQPPFLTFGDLGCFLASVAIAAIAYSRKKKDLVSLCIPVIAVFIFIFPLLYQQGPQPQELAFLVVYALSLTALAIRLEKYFPE